MYQASRPTVAIIGAGPFGVSIAAHLKAAGIDFRIFGKPMYRWRCQMPKGMFLKSEGCASSLSDPAGSFSLGRYCTENGLSFGEWSVPVSLDTFTQYSLSFQRRLVPNVEEIMITGLEESHSGFRLKLADGGSLEAQKVVVATGLEYTAHVPSVFSRLPRELFSHSSDHHNLSCFSGMNVTVIGGGQSALETAVLLSEAGASVHLVVRRPSLEWKDRPKIGRRSIYERIRYPRSNLGDGLELWIYSTAPTLFRCLPQSIRLEKVRTVLGPAGAWWLKDRMNGAVRILAGHSVRNATITNRRLVLQIVGSDDRVTDLMTDHVIAATGYRFDLQRLPFLTDSLKSRLRAEQQMPVLSSGFESSVHGLYFTGLASAGCFGPGMRFLQGADYAARSICRHVGADRARNRIPVPPGSGRSFKCRER